jgi:probable HAF family extracellular repeat protein
MTMLEAVERRILFSQSWFVSTGGSNANAGTLNAPLQTIQAAANLAQPGDTVMIMTGTYHETVTVPRSGTAAAPITFQPYNNQQVIISGADPVTGWTNYGGSIYDAPQSWDMGSGSNQVFVDGQMINEARYPNMSLDASLPTFATIASVSSGAPDNGWLFPSTATIYDPNLPGGAGAWNGATIHIANGQGWVVQTGTVLSSSQGSVTFSFEHLTAAEYPTAGNKYYLTGTFQSLSAAGEWYRDPTTGKLYVWTPNSDSPTSHDIQAKHRLYAFELSGRSYINVSGVTLLAASIDTSSSSNHVTISGITANYVSSNMLNPFPWDSQDAAPTTGILLNGTSEIFQNSTISYSSGDGVYVGGSNNIVQNNIIHDADYAGADGAGIEVAGSGQQILGNQIYRAGRSGIIARHSTADTIENNTVYNVGLQATDLGGIYAWGTDGAGTVIAYNTVHDIKTGGYGAAGVYLDNGSANYIVHDNTIYNVNTPILVNGPATNNQVYNNNTTGTSAITPNTTAFSGTGNGVTDLGTFGGFNSEAEANNNAGQIVGTSSNGHGTDAFLNSSGNTSDLGTLGGVYSIANDINNIGTIVGGAYPASGARHAFIYASGTMNDIGTLAGDIGSQAYGISNTGLVVGLSYSIGAVGHAFVWSNGQMQAIPTLGGAINAAFGVNDSGWIVGASTIAGDASTHAFLDANGTLSDLGTLGGSSSYALAINNSGQIVGQSLVAGNGNTHAFVYQNGTMTDLGTLPGMPNTVATSINNNGDIVGYAYNFSTFAQHAFLYRNGVMYDLNSAVPNNGWTFTVATGINDNGQIVGGGANPSGYSRAFTVNAPSLALATTIFANNAPSAVQQNVSDPSIPGAGGVELGVKFTSDLSGSITGVRFYKGTQNTGIHTGELWSSGGQLLANATFNGESSSGWQQVTFSSPVAIAANTVYIVSYHTNASQIAYTSGAFASAGANDVQLHALANGVSGSDGVYKYGASSFPTQANGQSPNYWVDVVFSTAGPVVPPTPTGLGATGTTSSSISLSWNASAGAASYLLLRKGPGNSSYVQIATPAGTSYTDSGLSPATTYSYEVEATSGAGTSLASAALFANTAAASSSATSIWSSSAGPVGSLQNVNDPTIASSGGVELGVKFRSDVAGTVTGVRFWKGSLDTGTHTGELWSSAGQRLATATFSGESSSGWQQVNFSSPVAISANTTYIVSYHTTAPYIAYTPNTFAGAGVDNAPLHALAAGVDGSNSVYAYGTGSFPTSFNGQSPNYWVDVTFSTSVVVPAPATLFGASAAPASSLQNVSDPTIASSGGVELGVKFRSDVAGTVTAVRFFKGSFESGTQTGELWSSTGQLLASATFTAESPSGWQQVNFATPVTIAANTTYIVSYHTTSPYIAYTPNTFSSSGIDNAPLHALATGVDGNNSVYAYGASSFPTIYNGQAANYWVDVVFIPS